MIEEVTGPRSELASYINRRCRVNYTDPINDFFTYLFDIEYLRYYKDPFDRATAIYETVFGIFDHTSRRTSHLTSPLVSYHHTLDHTIGTSLYDDILEIELLGLTTLANCSVFDILQQPSLYYETLKHVKRTSKVDELSREDRKALDEIKRMTKEK